MMHDSLATFMNKHILVIGDIVLDNYVYGDVKRINPEAPVPVLQVEREDDRLGGAANVAANVRSLGGSCTMIGQIGKDEAGKKIKKLLDESNIRSFLIEANDSSTILKKRIIARNQQVIRVDYEDPKRLNDAHIDEIIAFIKSSGFDLIIVSDYSKGVVCDRLMNYLKTTGAKIIVDPKPENMSLYKGVYVITPNLRESSEMSSDNDVVMAGTKLVDELGCNVVITRGQDGASLFDLSGRHHYVPSRRREVYDVVGAGDTFVAALSLAVSSGMELPAACDVANHASGIAVEKVGTSVVTFQELRDSLGDKNHKIKNVDELKSIVTRLREKGDKVVFTNGCFDILHVGHTKLLKEAKSYGDVLILGLNTDESIKRLKGEGRPVNDQNDRAEILSHIPYVDYIVLFNEETPCELISELKPDVHVKGGDYDPKDYSRMPEAKIVDGYGGKIVTVKYVDGKSTTKTINTLKRVGSVDL